MRWVVTGTTRPHPTTSRSQYPDEAFKELKKRNRLDMALYQFLREKLLVTWDTVRRGGVPAKRH